MEPGHAEQQWCRMTGNISNGGTEIEKLKKVIITVSLDESKQFCPNHAKLHLGVIWGAANNHSKKGILPLIMEGPLPSW